VVAVGRHEFDRSASRFGPCAHGLGRLIGQRDQSRLGVVVDLVHAVTVRPDVITDVIANVTEMSPRQEMLSGGSGDVITDVTSPAQGRLFRGHHAVNYLRAGRAAARTQLTEGDDAGGVSFGATLAEQRR